MKFQIPGTPVAKGRPRFARVGGFTRAFTPAKTHRFESLVALAAQAAGVEMMDGPLCVTIRAIFPMKGSPLKRSTRPAAWKTTKPDIDNVVKAILDGLEGVAFKADSAVVEIHASKIHAAQGDAPMTIVDIQPAQGDPDA